MRYSELFETPTPFNSPALAIALNVMAELPIVALLVGKRGPKTVAHIMVKSSEDAFIDAEGLHPLHEILDRAGLSPHDSEGWEMREITAKMLFDWTKEGRLPLITRSMVAPSRKKAREILATLGIAGLRQQGRTSSDSQ